MPVANKNAKIRTKMISNKTATTDAQNFEYLISYIKCILNNICYIIYVTYLIPYTSYKTSC